MSKNNTNYISSYDFVTVTKMDNMTAVTHLEKKNTKQRIQKLNKNEYVDISTGEIRKFILNDNRGQNLNSIGKTMNSLRELINANFSGDKNEAFGTVTYKVNQRNLNVVYDDLKRFIKMIRYKYRDLSRIEYITVLEPQQRGAWHAHILFKFIDIDEIDFSCFNKSYLLDIWRKSTGDDAITQVDLQSIENVKNVSSYLITYLANIPYDPDIHSVDDDRLVSKKVDGNDKHFIKGARLQFYPSGMRIYRSSRGIKRPEKKVMTYEKMKKYTKKIGHDDMTFSKTYNIKIKDFENTITRLEFSKP